MRGSREECLKLVSEIRVFLREELELELSETKTKITNANSEYAEFLSVRVNRGNHETYSTRRGVKSRNVKNLRFLAPVDTITKKLANNGFMEKGIPYPKFI